MNQETSIPRGDDLRAEYDETSLKNGVRGKYASRYAAGANVVRLDPDVAAVFTNEKAVNDALRLVVRIADDASQFTAHNR